MPESRPYIPRLFSSASSVYISLSALQLEVVSGVLRGQDVFAVLPTGARAYIMSMM